MTEFHKERKNGMDTDVKLAFSRQGAPTSPQTPNQIGEMGRLLNSGMKNVEVGALQPEIFDTIPKQHFKEMKRLAELTDSEISVHAPLIDPAGFTQQGWSEEIREENERQIKSIVERSHELDPKGNVPVNMHTTLGVPGETVAKEEGEEVKKVMYAVDREKGQLVPLKREELLYLGEERVYSPEERLEMLNESSWDDEKLKLMSYDKAKQELEIMNNRIKEDPEWLGLKMAAQDEEKGVRKMTPEEKQQLELMNNKISINEGQIMEYNRHLITGLNHLHHKYMKYREEPDLKDPNYREKKKAYAEWEKDLKKVGNDFRNYMKAQRRLYDDIENRKLSEDQIRKRVDRMRKKYPNATPSAILDKLRALPTPDYYIPAEEFTKEKSIETISNVAAHAYKKYGNKAPIIALENFMPTTVLSRAEGMKDLIEKSRKAFVEKVKKEKGLSESEAKRAAEKIIGATWDVGHISQLRKQGFTDKDIVKEAKKIAPYVKHVHLTDNFGYADSHLPLGMGDVPIPEQLKEFEKAADKERRNIVEAGAFVQHFKQSPLPQTLEHLDSSIYAYEAGPTWADARDLYASYLVGYGDILPQKHFDTFFGAGFSRLPKELGGQAQGNQSRFSGTPNQ